MFTGIIEEVGTVRNISKGGSSAKIEIAAKGIMDDVKLGDSIAVNGVCLTATKISPSGFTADVMGETIRRSSLGFLKAGDKVNLERAMQMNGRFGGHIVSGHIDGTGIISDIKPEDNATWFTIETKASILKYIIEKGSIAIDGISLTVAYVDDTCFKVSIIPHTATETTLLLKKKGMTVNLENDIVGKYIDKLLHFDSDFESRGEKTGQKSSGLDMNFLAENGFLSV